MRTRIKVAAAAATVVFAACSSGGGHKSAKATNSGSPTAPGHVVLGAFTLHDDSGPFKVGTGCAGRGANDKIKQGASVVVTNDNGDTIATGTLGRGSAAEPTTCRFALENLHFPDAATYHVAVAGQDLLTISMQDLASRGWRLEFGTS